jgi:hypothetical protein
MALVCATASIGASSAQAASPPLVIAPMSADVPISGGGGWLVWSVPVTGGWGLEAYHDGALTLLPVPLRPQPFDVSMGTDSDGAPVATYSRCAQTPKMEVLGSEAAGGSLLVPHSGAGCRLHILELGSKRERLLPIPHPNDSSDTTPSMWHGEVAFARGTRGRGDISQVMLWSPSHPQRLRALPQGTIPAKCGSTHLCTSYGEVQALDFDGELVTFLWAIDGPGVIGHGGWEIRVDDLADGYSSLAGSGIIVEACVGGGDMAEVEHLEPPLAIGNSVLFSEYRRTGCYESYPSYLHSYQIHAKRPSSGPLPGTALGLAKDGHTIYALAAPAPDLEEETGASCSATAPCTLEQIEKPALTLSRFKPEPLLGG